LYGPCCMPGTAYTFKQLLGERIRLSEAGCRS
jgi:hypothetical protein